MPIAGDFVSNEIDQKRVVTLKFSTNTAINYTTGYSQLIIKLCISIFQKTQNAQSVEQKTSLKWLQEITKLLKDVECADMKNFIQH